RHRPALPSHPSPLDDAPTPGPSSLPLHDALPISLGDTVIYQDGDVEAWPVWTITGPLEQLIAINHTIGASFTLTYSPGAGDEIVITTDPPTVRGPGGEVLTGALDWPGATLWGLVPGENRVAFVALGASAGTRIELTYVPRYETA